MILVSEGFDRIRHKNYVTWLIRILVLTSSLTARGRNLL